MKIAPTKTVGLVGAALLVGVAAVGCGNSDKGAESSSSSAASSSSATSSAAASDTTSAAATAAPADDYSKLLLKASDIDPSFTASPPETPPAGITGIGQTMSNAAQNQTITFQIVIETDPAAAVKRLDDAKATVSKDVDGAPQPADVGDGGFIATGKSPDGSKAVTEVYFTQGKAVTSVEFSSAPNDPVLPETALAIAKMQATQIKNNLT
ncbi:hypothetical protein Y900_010335 [Mycolicibacterium aromaticivorans JS19b1 = JCM 16368]|uniref:Lipoprotein LpqN n=1 Tax=Mycolicibacterium aromaticivorans JS19b1 = JCM 16368 TaxID=1440774 RepID=A0A064CFH1_9MYCO|nr:hypothetical protein [Mycolicibacterium aromaticivorans]KDE99329.1 hypothetical protein Y900_010335 [Mycolicibacterium aromaticivorans JS19b1 = JCM 16368]